MTYRVRLLQLRLNVNQQIGRCLFLLLQTESTNRKKDRNGTAISVLSYYNYMICANDFSIVAISGDSARSLIRSACF